MTSQLSSYHFTESNGYTHVLSVKGCVIYLFLMG